MPPKRATKKDPPSLDKCGIEDEESVSPSNKNKRIGRTKNKANTSANQGATMNTDSPTNKRITKKGKENDRPNQKSVAKDLNESSEKPITNVKNMKARGKKRAKESASENEIEDPASSQDKKSNESPKAKKRKILKEESSTEISDNENESNIKDNKKKTKVTAVSKKSDKATEKGKGQALVKKISQKKKLDSLKIDSSDDSSDEMEHLKLDSDDMKSTKVKKRKISDKKLADETSDDEEEFITKKKDKNKKTNSKVSKTPKGESSTKSKNKSEKLINLEKSSKSQKGKEKKQAPITKRRKKVDESEENDESDISEEDVSSKKVSKAVVNKSKKKIDESEENKKTPRGKKKGEKEQTPITKTKKKVDKSQENDDSDSSEKEVSSEKVPKARVTKSKKKVDESEENDESDLSEKAVSSKKVSKAQVSKNKKKLDESEESDSSGISEEEASLRKKKVNKSQLEKNSGRKVRSTRAKIKSYTDFYNSDDDDDEDENYDDKVKKAKSEKKSSKFTIPDDDSESDDEFKPDADESSESDLNVSEASVVSDSEPPTEESDSGEELCETPVKQKSEGSKRTNTNKRQTKKNTKKNASNIKKQESAKKVSLQSWPHLKYAFLQPDEIMDKNKQRPDHPDYDPKTLYVPKDFIAKQTPVMQQWWLLKSENFDKLLCYKVGKFYELYHMDAVIGARELGIQFMKGEVAHTGLPEINYGRHSQLLIEKGYKIARVEQTENPEMVKQRLGKIQNPSKLDKLVKREICQVSSKGIRVYTPLDNEPTSFASCYLLSIVERLGPDKLSTFGVCFIDTTIGEFQLSQFKDDRSNSKFLTLLAHYPPGYVIYQRSNLTPTTLKILNNSLPGVTREALISEKQFWSSEKVLKCLYEGEYFKDEEDSSFSLPDGLKPYLDESDSLGLTPAHDKELAVNALGGCVALLKDFRQDLQILTQGLFKTYNPPGFIEASSKKSQLPQNMILDAMTIHNLRILGNDGSLIEALDHTNTPFGKRLLREWICRPSCQKSVIIERQKAVTVLLENQEIVDKVRGKLKQLPDMHRLLSQIHSHGNPLKLKNHPDSRAIFFFFSLYTKRMIVDFITALNAFDKILDIIDDFSELDDDLINLCAKLEPEGNFPDIKATLKHFENAFDHESAKEEGKIEPKRGVDKDYDAALQELDDISKELDSHLKDLQKKYGPDVKYMNRAKRRYQVEIPDSKKVSDDFEFVAGGKKGFKRYLTPEAEELIMRHKAGEEEKDRVLKDINRRIFAKFSKHYIKWSKAVHNIAVLDCLISLSVFAKNCDNAWFETCIPVIHDDTDKKGIFVDIKEGKHPCLLSINPFIPNDTSISTNNAAPLIILTGPNMGGKSTLMRQVGIITVMAQIGCLVPAKQCTLTLVDRIFTRLGANDDIIAGQSTFLLELSETAVILKNATKYSLVLLDELGRGTSTYDGTAIAASVLEALTRINCRTLFSTHYHSLVEDFKMSKHVSLAHMACKAENGAEVTEENVKFLYKLAEGVCPKSYGFNAARLAGLPSHLVQRATEIATKLEAEVKLRRAFKALYKEINPKKIKSLLLKDIALLS